MSAAPRPGWYPDPAGTPELYRWWDGGDWTEAISESPRAPSPRTHHEADPAEDPVRRPSRFRAVVALLVCLALFLSATVGLGLAIWQDPPSVKRSARLPPGAVGSPGTGASGAPGRLDQSARVAAVGAASMNLPGPPYALAPDPMAMAGLLEVFFLADAPVHVRYDGRRTWSAAVLLGQVATPVAATGDLEEGAVDAVRRLSRGFFSAHDTHLADIAVADHAVDGHHGVVVTATVRYEISSLPSRYDEVTAVLVRLDPETVVAAISSVPDDAPAPVKAEARASLTTLRIG